jgi:hypothetical protein
MRILAIATITLLMPVAADAHMSASQTRCAQLGFRPGTTEFSRCAQREYHQLQQARGLHEFLEDLRWRARSALEGSSLIQPPFTTQCQWHVDQWICRRY